MAKKALCVGINDYPGTQNDLNGCLNDANAWADLLVTHYDFPKADVKLLLDSQATKANIMAGLKALLAGAKSGDVLAFSNSSHGTYVVDTSKDEPDSYDEALVPYDFSQNLIVDDELRELFSTLPVGVRLYVVSDSCHSGTVTRRVLQPGMIAKPRLLRPREYGARDFTDDQLTAASPKEKYPESKMKDLLLSGCTSKEYSYDAQIGGTFHGAMSYYAIQTIAQANYKLAWAELASKLGEALETEGYNQHPQLEGKSQNKKRQIFV